MTGIGCTAPQVTGRTRVAARADSCLQWVRYWPASHVIFHGGGQILVRGGTERGFGHAARSRPAHTSHEYLDAGADRYAAAAEMPVLKALLRISEAISRADYFDEVL